jgi:hypothetical protein
MVPDDNCRAGTNCVVFWTKDSGLAFVDNDKDPNERRGDRVDRTAGLDNDRVPIALYAAGANLCPLDPTTEAL